VCLPSRKSPKSEKIIKKLMGDLFYPLVAFLDPTTHHFTYQSLALSSSQNPNLPNPFSLMCDTCNIKRGIPNINFTHLIILVHLSTGASTPTGRATFTHEVIL
jgi:hypothetical protein